MSTLPTRPEGQARGRRRRSQWRWRRRALVAVALLLAATQLAGCVEAWTRVEVPAEYKSYFVVAAKRCPGILTPELLAAQAYVESHFRPDAVSSAGAEGMMQIIPEVWLRFGTDANGDGQASPFSPADSVATAAKYDCYLARETRPYGGEPEIWLAAYNAGPGAVAKYHGIPPYPETESYCVQVVARAEEFAEQFQTPSPSA